MKKFMALVFIALFAFAAGAADQKPNPHGHPFGNVDFDYNHSYRTFAENEASIKIWVKDPTLKQYANRLAVFVNFANLKHSTKVFSTELVPMDLDDKGAMVINVKNLEKNSVYRATIYFQAKAKSGENYGHLSQPFFFVTAGKLDIYQARARIVIRALGEAHGWKHTGVHHSSQYAGRTSGGWCDTFYGWNLKDDLCHNWAADTAGFWEPHKARYSSAAIIPASRKMAVMGDNLRISAHSAMLLAYDEDLNIVWTVEGNFNNAVRVHSRPFSGGWRWGHLVESMLRQPLSRLINR